MHMDGAPKKPAELAITGKISANKSNQYQLCSIHLPYNYCI